MDETKPNETEPKTLVSRKIIIALGTACIILAVSLVGSVLSYSSQISSLNSEVRDLNITLNFGNSIDWVKDQTVSQPAGSYSSWTFLAHYAGYVWVWVFSDTNNTYVQVDYTAAYVPDLYYDKQTNVGTFGTPAFPVLPSSSIEIRVGNTNTLNNATVTIARIEYVY